MKKLLPLARLLLAAGITSAADLPDNNAAAYDSRMALPTGEDAGGLRWIDGQDLPLEGKAFADVEAFYDRLPANVTEAVNEGVRNMKHHSAGLQFRFSTDSTHLEFRWTPWGRSLAMDHMPSTGVSGIDIYHRAPGGTWRYKATGRIYSANGGVCKVDWTPGEECIVNLPLYNGVRTFALGIDPEATVKPLPRRDPRPVVFYGTSITHGGCCSRPGLAFVNIVGRDLDVPVVNLGFSGSGRMELEMAEHLARIDASCYVLDCLWNISDAEIRERFEAFVRILREKRPDVPIVLAGRCDVWCGPATWADNYIAELCDRLVQEGWTKISVLPKDGMLGDDGEGTVDGVHPNDIGMARMAVAYGAAVRKALEL